MISKEDLDFLLNQFNLLSKEVRDANIRIAELENKIKQLERMNIKLR